MFRTRPLLGALSFLLFVAACDDATDTSSGSTTGAGGTGGATASSSVSASTTTDASSSSDASSSDASASSSTQASSSQSTGTGVVCGDAAIDTSEGCDDGNVAPGDGCDASCTIEMGYTCAGEPSDCATVCGDGLTVGAEACDDMNTAPLDGCDAACAVEHGFTCMMAPSACASLCGDGIVASDEACDDGNLLPGDGCDAACVEEPGYDCANEPSACDTTCGDGVTAGTEACDDGNGVDLDGCNNLCVEGTGESCAGPLGAWQANVVGGASTWTIGEGDVTASDAVMACDPNTHGPDAVIAYTKTTGTVANGGQLLHIDVDTPETSTGYYFNVEVTSGACDGASAVSEKCLWYKHDWDAYLDVPAGTYFVFVQKNSPATATVLFPDTTVMIEEVTTAAAEGEGCFAPYDSASAIYTPPATPTDFHTWTLPATVNSFDMGPTWGEPGSISCDNTSPYGDIHGVDAVIQFDKTSPTSVLLVEATNLDPVLTTSSLDLEILNVCDPTSVTKDSKNCRAKLDAISVTAPSPAGPVYIWVSTEGTSEEFDGASVKVREIFPGVGESWPTAQPITGSTSITPSSTMRLDAPSCMPPLGNVHWYAYTLQNDAVSISGTGVGPMGVYDAHGQPVQCITDASTSSVGALGSPGDTFYIAVPSGGAVTALSIADIVYTGVGAIVKDHDVTFPTSAVADQGMAVGPNTVFLGGLTKVFEFSKMGNELAKEHGAGDGLTATHLGYDLVFAGTNLFSVDSTTSTTANRVFRIYDDTTTVWGPTTWDTTPTYPASSPSHAITTDGTSLLMATRRTTVSADFYTMSLSAPSTPVGLGTNTTVWYVTGIAADSQYIYVASNGVSGEGVYRLSRASIGSAAVKIASVNTDTSNTNIEVDDLALAQNVYVRAAGDLFAIAQPTSASPVAINISTLGTTSDFAMTFDRANQVLYMFETETDAAGRIVRLQ